MQIVALQQAGCVRVFDEVGSGKSKHGRTKLADALDYLNPGDTLAVWRLDRLGRNTVELITVVNELQERGIEFRSLTESIDTSTSGGRLVFTIFVALAQMERELISDRTRAGLENARRQGRVGGRRPKLTPEQVQSAIDLHAGGSSIASIARTLGCSRDTISRALARQMATQQS